MNNLHEASLVAQSRICLQCRRLGSIPGSERPLEKGMAIHSSILAWRVSWTEEPGRLQFMGSQRAGHNWENNTLTNNSYNRGENRRVKTKVYMYRYKNMNVCKTKQNNTPLWSYVIHQEIYAEIVNVHWERLWVDYIYNIGLWNMNQCSVMTFTLKR